MFVDFVFHVISALCSDFLIQINLIKDSMLQTLDVLSSCVQECIIPLFFSVIMFLINFIYHRL